MKGQWRVGVGVVLVGMLLAMSTLTAAAHQPFFEDKDFTAAAPGTVKDPTVSTAIYATLDSPTDVDYVTFEGKQGQEVLIGVTIPSIAGQENFTPTVALIGRGLDQAALPKAVEAAPSTGAVILRADPGPAKTFFEPFSRTSYWNRQEKRFTLPADGRYTVAVWDERGDVGRYTLVVGDREVIGGDPAFAVKLPAYWTPVQVKPASSQATPTAMPTATPTPMPTATPMPTPTSPSHPSGWWWW